jgi:hypothetical protein
VEDVPSRVKIFLVNNGLTRAVLCFFPSAEARPAVRIQGRFGSKRQQYQRKRVPPCRQLTAVNSPGAIDGKDAMGMEANRLSPGWGIIRGRYGVADRRIDPVKAADNL